MKIEISINFNMGISNIENRGSLANTLSNNTFKTQFELCLKLNLVQIMHK